MGIFDDEYYDENLSIEGMNCENMYQFTIGDEMSATMSKASHGTNKSASSGNASRCSSEVAGERLYQNALETRKKIEEKIKEQSKVQKRTLNLATRGRRSREPSACPGTPPRYIQLYEYAKTKQYREEMEASTNSVTEVRDPSPSRNLGCERLYSLSTSKQQEGRERRTEIMKANERPPLPDSHYRKISVTDGIKIYERGMKHKINLEIKRMEAAFEMEELYVSPLIPNSVIDQQFSVPDI